MNAGAYGRFVIGEQLGIGGMGVVYQAHDPHLERQVALKVMSPHVASDPGFRRRFEREAKVLAHLDSPHIVSIYDYGDQDGTLWIATQLISGGDLGAQLARHGGMPPRLAAELTAQIARGLEHAHAADVLHRDIKPGNVLLRDAPISVDNCHAYLCDFGIAYRPSSEATQTRGVSGTWSYLAPERIAGTTATPASDIYALGCLLWACLSGKPPYRGTDFEIAAGHRAGPIPQLPGTDPLSQQLNQVLTRALAKAPWQRYVDAGEMRAELLAMAPTTGPHDETAQMPLGEPTIVELEPTIVEPEPGIEARATVVLAEAPVTHLVAADELPTVLPTAPQMPPTPQMPPAQQTEPVDQTAPQPAPAMIQQPATPRPAHPSRNRRRLILLVLVMLVCLIALLIHSLV